MMDGHDYEEQEPAPPGMFPGRFGMPGPPGFGAPFAGRKIPGFNEHGRNYNIIKFQPVI